MDCHLERSERPVHFYARLQRSFAALRMTDWIFAGHRTSLDLLLLTDELARGCIHICDQLRVIAAGAIDHMPDEIIFSTVPVKHVCDRHIPDFIPAMFLRHFVRLV